MTVTERTIVEQFKFWRDALALDVRGAPGKTHVITGCGTSYHLAQAVAASMNERGIGALAVPGGEWSRRPASYRPDIVGLHVVALSRSGESTETVQAAAASRTAGAKVTALTCVADSSLCHAADEVVVVATHPDEGIVMTASASLMLLLGQAMAGIHVDSAFIAAAEQLLGDADRGLAQAIAGRTHFVCLGGGPLYGVAQEAGIKLQEMSLSWVQAYHPMEYRHGPISLIDRNSFVAMLYHPDSAEEEARIVAEVQSKGAVVLGLGGPGDLPLAVQGHAASRGLLYLPVLQLLGERVAQMKGLDTTAPRHLQKVVRLG